jgi:hypothetical protein
MAGSSEESLSDTGCITHQRETVRELLISLTTDLKEHVTSVLKAEREDFFSELTLFLRKNVFEEKVSTGKAEEPKKIISSNLAEEAKRIISNLSELDPPVNNRKAAVGFDAFSQALVDQVFQDERLVQQGVDVPLMAPRSGTTLSIISQAFPRINFLASSARVSDQPLSSLDSSSHESLDQSPEPKSPRPLRQIFPRPTHHAPSARVSEHSSSKSDSSQESLQQSPEPVLPPPALQPNAIGILGDFDRQSLNNNMRDRQTHGHHESISINCDEGGIIRDDTLANPMTIEERRRGLTKSLPQLLSCDNPKPDEPAQVTGDENCPLHVATCIRFVETVFNIFCLTPVQFKDQVCSFNCNHVFLALRVPIWIINVAFLVSSAIGAFQSWFIDSSFDPIPKTDLAVGLGSFMLMLSSFVSNRRHLDGLSIIWAYSRRRQFSVEWARTTRNTFLFAVGWWCSVVVLRLCFFFVLKPETANGGHVFHLFGFIISSATLSSSLLLLAHVADGLRKMIDGFLVVLSQRNMIETTKEWDIVVLIMRQVSDGHQWNFLAIALTAVLMVILLFFDLIKDGNMASIPNMMIGFAIPLCLLSVAGPSSVCMKLPALVSMMRPCETFSENLELVSFLKESEAGFYVFDTRITLGFVFKFIYFTFFSSTGFMARTSYLT